MSRIASRELTIPQGVEVSSSEGFIRVEGPLGSLQLKELGSVSFSQKEGRINFDTNQENLAIVGTYNALLKNMISGVSVGFVKKLTLVGVGYRAQLQGNVLKLSLGFSHPVDFLAPEGVKLEVPSQTEIIIKGSDKQIVGQVAAKIRSYRPPEPYKGKGVRYSDERVIMKEAKKK